MYVMYCALIYFYLKDLTSNVIRKVRTLLLYIITSQVTCYVMYNPLTASMVSSHNTLANPIGSPSLALVSDVLAGSHDLSEDNRKLLDKLMFILINCEEKLPYQ